MIRLLGRKTSGNVQKVLFLLEELGLPYRREDYGRQFENTATAEYLAMNPMGKVPTLLDGDVVVWESNTILRYLAAKHSPALGGETPAEAAAIEPWMDWLLATVNAPYLTLFKETKKEPAERSEAFAPAAKELNAALKMADGRLEGTDYLALGRLSLADIACASVLKRCMEFPVERPELPNLTRWMDGLLARPAFQVALGERTSTLAEAA
ncbi:glutathione S-transferase family protein [Acuticoccus mangrovi]|uniref:Glutathione S-transferase family protein n=1 Tax=Acuticoccus mangrovi TaxID=2796142 RepID=A0A934MC59_9HYPH|nr:glutathione S-transferase family protein [Acuticoccus mangrovi]MBJ3774912.1 glutathione S-transferase family protein [Acuticoccus mangrovi]